MSKVVQNQSAAVGTTKHESEEMITQRIDFELSMAMYTAYKSADSFGIE